MKAFLNELWARLSSETPAFFNKVKIFGAGLVATGMSLKAIENLPASLVEISGQIILAGSIMAALAQCAMKHPEQK